MTNVTPLWPNHNPEYDAVTPMSRFEVKVRGIKIKTGRSTWLPRKYVVQDPVQAFELARQDGVEPEQIYGKRETTKELDPRLRMQFQDGFGRPVNR